MKKVAIIGAGITGLSAAFYLSKHSDLEIDLFEKDDRAGGKIRTHQKDGYTIELGPESYLARKTIMTELAEEICMGEDLVRNSTGQSYIYSNNKLSALPKGAVLGVPTELVPFLTTDLVSVSGKLSAGLDLFRKPVPLYTDVSVGRFFRRRLGDDVLENMIEPLLSGIYATNIDELSLMSTFPYFKDREEKYGSLIKGAIAEKPASSGKPAAGKTGQFLQFRNGLQSFIDRLLEVNIDNGVNAHFANDVEAITKNGEMYTMQVNGGMKEYDHIIITTPHFQYKRWFEDLPLEYFKHMEATSVATVVMAFDQDQVKNDIDGTGFVVSRRMDTAITACTWTSKKWKHSTPSGKALLRAYVGRPGDFIVHEKSDEEIVNLARRDLDKIMDLEGDPEFTIVTRMIRSMPQYKVGHKSRVDAIRKYMTEHYPGVILTGASHHGVGLPDCVSQAKAAVESIIK
ncbi:MAG TPA: protoporphyrinogen oxidase [Candidatus Salinicoccus stercoripullorum]|uniref:Coproporphyrinogen III oxidase n=1 Tax=Candidatus Salinicoccus stercoripullorum TaxID=2838756 RepID=A0A9D1QJN9_9STAP|nr:protoporphyrinogen oxidase [Candidatus Salinicoccus stercoripullorum]